MKKHVLLCFAFVIAGSFVSAQDFQNTYWNMDITNIYQTENITFRRNDDDKSKMIGHEYLTQKTMLGKTASVSYFFKHNRLKAAGYAVKYTDNTLNTLKEKLKKKYGPYIIAVTKGVYPNTVDQEGLSNSLKEANLTYCGLLYEDVCYYKAGGGAVIKYWIEDKDKIEKTDNKGGLYIYESLSSTIYVAACMVPETIIVLYTEREEDF